MGGLTGNPWALDRSAGGSSSGSGAAVAAGPRARRDRHRDQRIHHLPGRAERRRRAQAHGRLRLAQQVVPISASQDVPGPLARTVADAALVYEVLSGRDDCVAACVPEAAAALHVGVAEQWLSGHDGTDALFAAAVDALTGSSHGVQSVSLPPNDFQVHEDQVTVLVHEMADDLDAYLAARPGTGVRSLAAAVDFNREHPGLELAHFGQEYLEAALASGGRASEAYRLARERNVAFARDACLGPAFASGVDVLVAPAYQPAWKSDLVHGDQVSGGGANCTPPGDPGLADPDRPDGHRRRPAGGLLHRRPGGLRAPAAGRRPRPRAGPRAGRDPRAAAGVARADARLTRPRHTANRPRHP